MLAYLFSYAVLASLVGFSNHRKRETSQHFLHTNRDIPFWAVSLSFLAANCSALEALTMIGVASRYGMIAVHFYWIGAIPALAFLLCVLLPKYRQLEIRSVPEYLGQRFGRTARLLSAASFCLLMVAVAGITLCVSSRVLHLALGWSYGFSIWFLAITTTAFLLAGGLSSVIYSEALQLIVFIIALVPLTIMTLRNAGGFAALIHTLPSEERHALRDLPFFAPHAPADLLGVLLGLGFILSFSYWCVDFLLIQRLYAARNARDMMRTPIIAIAAKLVLPLILVVPGLGVTGLRAISTDGSFDLSLPSLLLVRYPNGIAALAMAAIAASLFFGICGNISAGVAIFTCDLYKPAVGGLRADRHYLHVGQGFTVFMGFCAAGAAYLAFGTSTLMDYIQLVLSSLNVPIATVLLMGIFVPHISRCSGSAGILAGTAGALVNWDLARPATYGSGLGKSFYGAIIAASCSIVAMLIVSSFAPDRTRSNARQAADVFHTKDIFITPFPSLRVAIAALLMMVSLYVVFG